MTVAGLLLSFLCNTTQWIIPVLQTAPQQTGHALGCHQSWALCSTAGKTAHALHHQSGWSDVYCCTGAHHCTHSNDCTRLGESAGIISTWYFLARCVGTWNWWYLDRTQQMVNVGMMTAALVSTAAGLAAIATVLTAGQATGRAKSVH